jgi:Cu/Ag efflux pump CusA
MVLHYLRDAFEVRRGIRTRRPAVEVLEREKDGRGADRGRAMVAAEMKEGRIIREFDTETGGALARMQTRLAEGMHLVKLSDQPAAVAQRVGHFLECFLEAVAIVILVAVLLMEWRSALVVATAIR